MFGLYHIKYRVEINPTTFYRGGVDGLMGYLLGDGDYKGFLDGGCFVKVFEGLFVEG